MRAFTPTSRAAAALLVIATACGDPTAASGPPVEFALRTIDGTTLPTPPRALGNGVDYAVVSGAMSFERFPASAGQVAVARTVRLTEADGESRYETRVAPGTFTRRGDTVAVAYRGTRHEWYVLEDGGRTLRTIASGGCDAPPGIVCPDILSVSVYERVD